MRKLICFILLSVIPMVLSAQTYTLYNSANSDLPHNELYDIAFDNYGNIWFGGKKGATGLANVSMLSQDLSTWTVYDAQDADLGMDQTEDRAFYIAVDHMNNKWFCTHYGISYLKADGTPGASHVNNYTRSVFVDKKGIIYISDRDLVTIEVSTDDGETWTSWTADTLGMSTGRPEIYDIEYDGMGRLWICTYYGVFYRDLTGSWNTIAEVEGEYTYGMAIDLMDNVWVPVSGANELYQIASNGTVTVHDSTTIETLIYLLWLM